MTGDRLFDDAELGPTVTPVSMSADARRTARRREALALGKHPLRLDPLREPAGETCGSCKHLAANRRNDTYYKCILRPHEVTRGAGSDVRLSWPACIRWEDTVARTAVVDGPYRYRLGRVWEPELPRATFVMVNPSVADGLVDDLTITKCIGFAARWGMGAIDVVNLYAYVATDPDDLIAAHRAGVDVRGPDNIEHVTRAIEAANVVVAAWGHLAAAMAMAGAQPANVVAIARELNRPLMCLGRTAAGAPRHPSRLGYSAELIELA